MRRSQERKERNFNGPPAGVGGIWNIVARDQNGTVLWDPAEIPAPPLIGVWYDGDWWTNSVRVTCSVPRRAPVANHCGVTIGVGGKYTRYDGEPSSDSLLEIMNPFSPQPLLIVQVTPGTATPFGDIIFQASVPQATTSCIQTASADANTYTPTYSIWGPNSNTWASYATSHCGLTVNYPRNAIGAP